LDIGPETRKKFSEALQGAKLIFWNGPLGVFEAASLREGTREVAQTVASLTKKGSTSIIGGGDTASAIQLLGFAGQMSHLSTGGGASLEYLEGQVLPGIAALEDKVVQEASKR
jgi:phosphoglycerate kinase